MLGTAIHETLHALGFDHEQCRSDRGEAITVKELNNHNYQVKKDSKAVTIFDPFSVMLYNETEKLERK
mgnify:CR=1 FL=1